MPKKNSLGLYSCYLDLHVVPGIQKSASYAAEAGGPANVERFSIVAHPKKILLHYFHVCPQSWTSSTAYGQLHKYWRYQCGLRSIGSPISGPVHLERYSYCILLTLTYFRATDQQCKFEVYQLSCAGPRALMRNLLVQFPPCLMAPIGFKAADVNMSRMMK